MGHNTQVDTVMRWTHTHITHTHRRTKRNAHTHLSPGHSPERRLRCTGSEGPAEASRGQNRTASLSRESRTGRLPPLRRGRRRKTRTGRRGRRGCAAKRSGMAVRARRGWRRRMDWMARIERLPPSRRRWTPTPLHGCETRM